MGLKVKLMETAVNSVPAARYCTPLAERPLFHVGL